MERYFFSGVGRTVSILDASTPTPTTVISAITAADIMALQAENERLRAACEDALPHIIGAKNQHQKDGDELAAFYLTGVEKHLRAALTLADTKES